MSDIPSSNWSETAANNTAASPNGWPANSPPTIVYAADREMMGAIKRDYNRRNPTQTAGGTANALTLTYTSAPTAYVQGDRYCAIIGTTNTGATTLNVNGLGAKAVRMDNAALVGGEQVAGSVVEWVYDGTQFQIISSRAQGMGTAKNWLINGDMEVWQRDAGGSASIAVSASTTAYTVDRFYISTGTNQAFTISQQTGLTNGSRYCARVQRNSGQTGTGTVAYGQPLDSDVIAALRGSIVTISAKLRSGANWSPTSGQITMNLYVGTGSVGKRGGGFTSETVVAASATNLGTSSSVTTATATSAAVVPTNASQGELQFAFTPTGTASTNDYVEIDEVMICISPVATAFERRPFLENLALCLPFFQKTFGYATAPAQSAGTTNALGVQLPTGATGTFAYEWRFVTQMRTSPSITTYNPSASNANWRDTTNSADRTASLSTTGVNGTYLQGSSGVAASANFIHAIADAEI